MSTASAASSVRTTPPARRGLPCSVLVVDDDSEARCTARVVLEHFGFVVVESRTGLEALALAQATRPRIVLLDVVLPEIDGALLARMLHADPTTRNAAVIAVSASEPSLLRERGVHAWCDAFLAKPVPPLQLAATVAAHARRTARIRP